MKNVKSEKNKYRNIITEKVENQKLFKLLLLIGILFVMFYTPYLRGLYFETEQFVTQIILFSLFAVYWIYKWIRKDNSFLRTPIEYTAFGMAIIYFLSSFTAVSQRLAVSEFLKYAMYFAVFYMLSDLIKTEKEKSIVLWVIVSSAMGLSIIGIDSAAGGTIVNVFNSIFKAFRLDFQFFGLFVDGRIHSTMQYPNAFASYLLAVFFVSVSLAMTSGKWIKALSSGISFVLLTTLIFTVSRGAYILLILAVIMFLLLIPKERKLNGLYNLFTIGIISGGFSLILSKFIFGESSKIYIWPIIIIGTLLAFFIRMTDDFAIKTLKKINFKIAAVGSLVLVTVVIIVTVYVFNASMPLELGHSTDQKEGFVGLTKIVTLNKNQVYKLVLNAEANSINDKAAYAYRVYIKSINESGTSTDNDLVILNEIFNKTEGVEKEEIEFLVPESSGIVSVQFQNYYSGTSAIFYDAKIYNSSGEEVKNLILKRKYSFAESILSRFENIQSDTSFNNRITFLKDGFKIFKDWWVLGAGGGAWSILNFKYQSYLYWSTQTHNYPLQVAVEAGLIGLTLLVLLFVYIVIAFIKLYKNDKSENINGKITNTAVFTAVVFLFLHAGMDFDFSLASIYLLAWVLIAILNSEHRKSLLSEVPKDKKKSSNKISSDFKFSINGLRDRLKKGLNVYPAIMIILTTVVLIYPIIFYNAYTYSNKALDSYKENKIDEAIELMEKATSLDFLKTEYVTGYTPISSKPDIRMGYVDLILKKLGTVSKQSNDNMDSKDKSILNSYMLNAQKIVKRVEDQAKFNSDLSLNLGIYYLNTTEKEKGIEYINNSIELKRLVPSQWQYKANAYYATAINYFQQGNNEKGLEYIDNTINIIDEARIVNGSNLKPFVFNTATQEYIEKAYYIKSKNGNSQIDIGNLLFQSVFKMDINCDNNPDQWTFSDNNEIEVNSEGVLSVRKKDLSKSSYISSKSLAFEAKTEYLIEVELSNQLDIESIPFAVRGITTKTEQLYLKDNVLSAKISTPTEISDNKLIIYINGEYKIKNIRIIKA